MNLDFEHSKPNGEQKTSGVETVSLANDITIEVPFDTQAKTIQVVRWQESNEPQPIIEVKVIPSNDDPDTAPTITVKDDWNPSIEHQKVVKHLDLVDLHGFPTMYVIDYHLRKCIFVPLSPRLVRADLEAPKRLNPKRSDQLAQEVLNRYPIIPTSYREDLIAIVNQLKTLPQFSSLDEAHRFIVNAVTESMRASNVSEEMILQVLDDKKALWDTHKGLMDTLHGQLHMRMRGETAFWDDFEEYLKKNPGDEQGFPLEAYEKYKSEKIQQLEKQHWLIAQKQVEYDTNPVTGQTEIKLSQLGSENEKFTVLMDESSGYQIAFEWRGDRYRLLIGGKRSIQHPAFVLKGVFQFNASWYSDVTSEVKPSGESNQVDISNTEEWNVVATDWIEYAAEAHVFIQTDEGLKSYFVERTSTDAYGKFEAVLVVQSDNPELEHVFKCLIDASEVSDWDQSVMEATAARAAREIYQLEENSPPEKPKNDQEKKKRTTSKGARVWGTYNKYYKIVEAFLPNYNLYGKNGIFDRVLNRVLDPENREKIEEIISREKPLNRDEDDALFKQQDEAFNALYSLTYRSHGPKADPKEFLDLFAPSYSAASHNLDRSSLATYLITLAGLPNRAARRKDIQRRLGSSETFGDAVKNTVLRTGPFIRYKKVWNEILDVLDQIDRDQAQGEEKPKRGETKSKRDAHGDDYLLNIQRLVDDESNLRLILQDELARLTGTKPPEVLDDSQSIDDLRDQVKKARERTQR